VFIIYCGGRITESLLEIFGFEERIFLKNRVPVGVSR
jgi:hypothetical protein